MKTTVIATTCGLGVALVCLLVGTAPAAAAEPGAPLARGAGYAAPSGSADVRTVQRQLRLAGQRPGALDGRFGARTEAAVIGFQQNAGISVDGVAGPRTQAALARATGLLAPGAGYGETGGSGVVRRLQRRLRRAGERPGPVDGRFGPRTEAAVKRLQARTGVAADGVVDRGTASALDRELERVRARRANTKPARPAPAATAPPGRVRSEAIQRTMFWPALAVGAVIGLLLGVMLLAVVRPRRKPDPGLAATALPVHLPPPPFGLRPTPLPPPPLETPAVEGAERDAAQSAPEELPVLGYASVAASADELHEQAEAIGSECQKRGLDLLELVREREPLSGKGLGRSGLDYALRRVLAGEAQGLVVADLERLTRSPAELGQVLDWVLGSRARLIVANAEIDTRERSGRLATRTLIEVSGWERKQTAERTREGLDAARLRRRKGVDLLARIARMRDEGMTLQAIANRLNQEGVPTLRGGKLWRSSSVLQAAADYRRPKRDLLGNREGRDK